MKKLALALVCLMGVAFFTSCDPTEEPITNPEPAIAFSTEDGYLVNGQAIDVNVAYPLKVTATANADTQKELARLVITGNGETMLDSTISGKEFIFEGEFTYPYDREVIVPEYEIKATVTDVDGKTNSASITVSVNKEDALVPADFTWNRHGGQAATGNLGDLGLEWKFNAKEIYAVITPKEGVTMYDFTEIGRDVWGSVVTATDKARLFGDETLTPITELRKISCTQAEQEYDIVLGTIYNEETYLIHITKSAVYTFNKDTDVTIYGQVK